jgi:hypothetical protein
VVAWDDDDDDFVDEVENITWTDFGRDGEIGLGTEGSAAVKARLTDVVDNMVIMINNKVGGG